MFEIIGIVAAIFELAAVYLVGQKDKKGFLVGIIGNILWITYSLLTFSAFGLILVCSLVFILNIRGYILWTKFMQD
jgi:nicotinamide riboside transporter PnuC